MISSGGGNSLFGLAAAALWGGGDFSGGMGVKNAGGSLHAALRVVLLSHVTSFTVLVTIALLRRDAFPHGALLAWAIGAGVMGGVSLTCFYIALSRGAMGVPAAVSGLLAAAIPSIVASLSEGAPGTQRVIGFIIAGAAIWLIAAGPGHPGDAPVRASTGALAIVAGAGFGVYFVALKMAAPAGLVWPMAMARTGSLTVCSLWAMGLEIFFARARRSE